MASRGRGARLKGSNFERIIANELSEATGLEFKRGLGQTRGGGVEVADVVCATHPELHFELKRHQKCDIKKAYEQAVADSNDKDIRIIITKDDNKPRLVTMEYPQWLEFFKLYVKQ